MPRLHAPPAEKASISRSPDGGCSLFRNPCSSAHRLLGLSVLFPLLASSSQAGLVYWGSPGFVRNSDSRGQVWTEDFSMSLGVFRSGFVPTEANREEWQEKWTGLGVADFDPAESRFAGVLDLSQPLPAGTGTQVYFWASNGMDLNQGPEWILLTRQDWKWPSSSSSATPALIWTTGSQVTPVMGAVGSMGSHLVSSQVTPLTVIFEDWLAGYFPDGTKDGGPDDDADGDGLSNRLEYFLGSDPGDPSSRTCPQIASTADGISLTLVRNPKAPSSFGIETSTDLKVWAASNPERVQDRPDLIEVRFPRTEPAVNTFFRFKLETAKP